MIKQRKMSFIFLLIVFILMIFILQTKVYARNIKIIDETKTINISSSTGIIDPSNFEPDSPTTSDVKKVVDKANIIIGAIRVIGVVVAVVTLGVLGIKYMTGSVTDRADYKKTMIPYLIGALVFFALTQFIGIIASIADDI